jgi:hypothetical protein
MSTPGVPGADDMEDEDIMSAGWGDIIDRESESSLLTERSRCFSCWVTSGFLMPWPPLTNSIGASGGRPSCEKSNDYFHFKQSLSQRRDRDCNCQNPRPALGAAMLDFELLKQLFLKRPGRSHLGFFLLLKHLS